MPSLAAVQGAARRKATARARASVGRNLLTRDIVLGAAESLIEEHGADAFAMRALARRLNVTATALYLYFDDKLDVLKAVAEAEYDRRAATYSAIQDPDPIMRIGAIARTYVEIALRRPELFRLTMQFPPIEAEPVADEVCGAGRRAFTVAEGAVEEAIRSGRMAAESTREASLIIWAAIHGVAAFVLERASFTAGRELQLADRVVSAVLRGLANNNAGGAQPTGNIGESPWALPSET